MARSFTSVGNQVTNSAYGAPPSQGTVSIWIRPNWNGGDSTTHEFWQFAVSGPVDRPSFQKYMDNNIYAGFNSGGEQRIIIAASSLFTSGVWANWVFTYSSAGCVLYKNGVSVGTKGAITIPGLGAGYTLGRLPASSQNCNSGLAEFALWNSVFSPAEVAALAAGINPLSIRPGSLKIYLPLFGLGSGEPEWGPSHLSQSLTGTAYQNHAPVGFWMPPGPINPPQFFRASAALTQGNSPVAIAAAEKFRVAVAAVQQNFAAAVAGREKFASSLALIAPADIVQIYGVQQQEGHPGRAVINDAAIGGLLAADDCAAFGLAPADAALYDVTITESLS